MKILFLDIDGVLNSVEYAVGANTINRSVRLDDADPVKVGLLRFICDQTDARIVISSTWRIGRDPAWFDGFFSSFGWFQPPIEGVTPRSARIGSIGRGDEINEWLETRQVDRYVIVDDDSDFYGDQPLVQTNGVYGLTLKETIEMIDILGLGGKGDLARVESLRRHVDFKPKN